MVAVAPPRERVLKQNDEKKKTTKPPTSHRLKSGVLKLELLK